MRCGALLFVVVFLAGCGGSTSTVIESSTTTETDTVSTTVTTSPPLPPPDPNKPVSCSGGACYQQDASVREVDFKYGDENAAEVGSACGNDGTWQDAGADPNSGAGLYKCVQQQP